MRKLLCLIILTAASHSYGAGPLSPALNSLIGDEVNTQGTPIVKMWTAPYPEQYVPHAGFEPLDDAEHVLIYQPIPNDGNKGWGYSHHSQLIFHSNRFYAIWSSNWDGEDAPGQRVLFSSSEDGVTWSTPEVIFDSPDTLKDYADMGYYLAPIGLRVVDDKLYACSTLFENIGWENVDSTSLVTVRDNEHVFRKRRFVDVIARTIEGANDFGTIFALGEGETPSDVKYEISSYADHASPQVVAQLWVDLERAMCRPALTAVDDARLSEPTSYRAPGGELVLLLRDDVYSHRMYVSHSDDDGKTWSVPQPTNIPDSPSLTFAVNLDDGRILLVGNQNAPEASFDQAVPPHLGRDPLMVSVSDNGYEFDRAYALRSGKQKHLIPDVHGRGVTGGQYPSAIVHDEYLYVLYSMGKEAIWMTRVPLSSLDAAK